MAMFHLQMVSLLHLAEITEEGVTFASPVDGSRMLLTPEHSIAIQNQLGKQLKVCQTAAEDQAAHDRRTFNIPRRGRHLQ